ncbi:COQ3 family protein [Megaselia abdita]
MIAKFRGFCVYVIHNNYHTLLKRPVKHFNEESQRLLAIKSSFNAGDQPLASDSKAAQNLNKEVIHHNHLASEWWDQNGPLKGLHSLNQIRIPFIRDGLVSRNYTNKKFIGTSKVLEGLDILEVGCGGGILTEGLGRLSANVTAIDLGESLIQEAVSHINDFSPELKSKVNYKLESIESHSKKNLGKYDAVIISEVIEHIDDKPEFITNCLDALKPGGSIFITTLNKTAILWVCGIILAENVFKLVPEGTHHWNKIISHRDMQVLLDSLGCQVVVLNGYVYEFWKNSWLWTKNTDFCYAIHAIKR